MADQQEINAAVLHGTGQVPRYERFPAPVAGDGEAVVTVTAAALKPFDRWWADGAHHASPRTFPQVVGADGVGRLSDGTRVAFLAPQRPYGGMAEQALVRSGVWFPVPDEVDDVTAAAITNPGMAAWKSVVWEGGLTAQQSVLVLGGTSTSGRIAAQLAVRLGARVVAAGRNRSVLDELAARGAAATIRIDGPPEELVAAIADSGPYDLVVDYLWGAPAEAVFAAFLRADPSATGAPERIRYLQVGMAAGEVAAIPSMALRSAPIQLVGSGRGGAAPLSEAAAAYADLLGQVVAGEIVVAAEPVPLADVEGTWLAARSDRRVVFVP